MSEIRKDAAPLPERSADPGLMLSHDTLSALVIGGDLSRLNQAQKIEYYRVFCQRIGLDPATQPFKLLKLQGKETLYCDRGGAAQLCKLHNVSHEITSRVKEDDLYIVTAKAKSGERQTESIGAVAIMSLKGEALANALMKAETKAKRRATLDLLGLGMLDETETETIPGAARAEWDPRPTAQLPPPEALDDEDRKAKKKARAALNKALQAACDAKTFAIARGIFQKEYGKDIWEQHTHHNDRETFMDLVHEHWARVDEDTRRASENAAKVEEWKAAILACTDLEAFFQLEKEFEGSFAIRDNTLHVDMLREKGRELGQVYADDLGEGAV